MKRPLLGVTLPTCPIRLKTVLETDIEVSVHVGRVRGGGGREEGVGVRGRYAGSGESRSMHDIRLKQCHKPLARAHKNRRLE